MMRRHGLQSPLDPHQVSSWLIFFALASGVYAFYVPFVEDAGTRWFLVATYSILVVLITALDLYTSYLDPSDPGLMGATDGEFFCGLCQASVARNSKHCRACDRCVEGFDHHCKWLNNCVGARNYWHFFALISSTVSLLVLQLAWGLWLFIRSFIDKPVMRALVYDKYGSSVVYGGWQAALALYMGMLIAAVIMLGELFFFHIVLISKGMTTYDYIIAQRDAKLAAPLPSSSGGSGHVHAGCRSSRVADATTAKRKIKIGINPCAAIKTSKPKGNPAEYGHSAAAGKAAAAAAVAGSGNGAGSDVSHSHPPPADKLGLEGGVGNVSLGAKAGMTSLSEKAAAGGSVHDLVARAVAEQHGRGGGRGGGNADSALLSAVQGPGGALREPAALGGGGASAGGGRGGVETQGCVPECSTGADGGGGHGGHAAADFTSLVPSSAHRHQHQQAGLGPSSLAGAGAVESPARSPGQLAIGVAATPPGSGQGAAGGSFDAAMPSTGGRHLGGHAAGGSPAGRPASAAPMPTPPSSARGKTLPPLMRMPSANGQAPATPGPASAPRSLLFPAKTPSGSGGRELLATPE